MDAEARAYLDALRLELRRDLAEAIASAREANRADLAEARAENRRDLTEAIASAREANRADLAEARVENRRDLTEAIASAREANRADLAEARAENRRDLTEAIASAREASRADLAEATVALRAEIRTEAVETRRHFDVVAEGLRDDIRLVGEGVVANTESIGRLRSDIAREMDERFHVVHLAFADTRRDIGELRALIR